MRIALAQINPTVGDLAGNLRKHLEFVGKAKEMGAEVVVFPELSVCGYPPKDLLLKGAMIDLCAEAVEAIARAAVGVTVMVGYPERNTLSVGRPLHNAVAVVRDGKIVAKRFKSLLPTYDVFDESRYFEPGSGVAGAASGESGVELTFVEGKAMGLTICEDLWNDEEMIERPLYHLNPIEELVNAGAEVVVNVSASPFVLGKHAYRLKLFTHQAKRWRKPIVYVNQVGGNDDLVFDGNSFVVNGNGDVIAQAKGFGEELMVVDLAGGMENAKLETRNAKPLEGVASVHAALVLGLRDYVRKCGFKSAVLGLSGGIDSAVVAALAVEALGAGNVVGVALPSRYSSDHSLSDAEILARNLGIAFHTVPIEGVHGAMEGTLAKLFEGTKAGLAEENVQARLRGNILMALSNKFGHLLLTTGNKSEVATGYCTLYGDMCGGLAVISDVPKMMVYELARYMNAVAEKAGRVGPIPEGSITKPPSAELRPNQKDQDSLPAYEILDAILERYVEREMSVGAIVAEGFERAVVERVARLVDLSEYKRKQMAPGLKVTSRAFGTGRRMPIAQGYDPKWLEMKGIK